MNRLAPGVLLLVVSLLSFPAFAADDSCDVIVAPAATLLLPYFEVDLSTPEGETTLFTVTNVTQRPQIASVTLWTDLAYPVFTFDLFLTGYDAQSINLYDLIARGRLAEPPTTSQGNVGRRSLENDANPLLDTSGCGGVEVGIRPAIADDIRSALTSGRVRACDAAVGTAHAHAIGYATIDAVARCGSRIPSDPEYFTRDLLYENVLTGDYQQVNALLNYAQGGALVHIRAMEPGAFARTFYGNLLGNQTGDRRQPLPSTFAARWVAGGSGDFTTSFKVWREAAVPATLARCSLATNRKLGAAEIVRFDEHENPTAVAPCADCAYEFTASSRIASSAPLFPPNHDGGIVGWMFMDLDDAAHAPGAAQSWVTVSMAAEGRYSADFDAASLATGCARTEGMEEAPDDSCEIRVAPAATLLLPYFEVNLQNPAGETTLFSITNVTPLPHIARVTLWSDFGYPVLTFNLFLTGYDVQPINLFDVLARGRIADPRTTSRTAPGARSAGNDDNPLLDLRACGELPDRIPGVVLADVQAALTTGRASSCGTARIGALHERAIGYATVDVVQNCGDAMPLDAGYFSTQLLYENALIGDYEQVNAAQNFAQANAMVHIRAIPEGGVPGAGETTLARTFYGALQPNGARDRRQPLPSAFAARWISGGATGYQTRYKLWRAGTVRQPCAVASQAMPPVVDIVRFDEEENPSAFYPPEIILARPVLPLVGRVSETSWEGLWPPNLTAAVGGWMYINVDEPRRIQAGDPRGQAWVVVSMAADGRYSVDFDATAFADGCGAPISVTDEDGGQPAIGSSLH